MIESCIIYEFKADRLRMVELDYGKIITTC